MASSSSFDLLGLDMQGEAALNPTYRGENKKGPLWQARDGSLIVTPVKQALVWAGRVYQVTVGTVSTGITGGGAGTILDPEQPELRINVPAGMVIQPLYVGCDLVIPVGATDADEYEIEVVVDRTQSSVTGTFTTETAINMRTDIAAGSRAGVHSAFSADTVTPVESMMLRHTQTTFDLQSAVGTTFTALRLDYGTDSMPVIVGPAMLLVYFGGTAAVTGFVQCEWAEWLAGEVGL